MSSDDEVAKLEAQLQKPKAERAVWKAAEERQIAKERAAAEVKRIAKEKAAVEARQVEERRRAELEERWRAVATVKAWEEAEGRQIVEGLVAAAAAKCKAVLAVAGTAAEQAIGLPAKQKGRAEGDWLACDHCADMGV